MLARRPAVSFAHKEKLSYEQRCYESTRVREKYSDRFPVIVERDSNSDVPAIDKCAQTPRMQEATRTLTIRCMHILHTRAGNTLRTPARCYPQAIHANPLTHPQVQVPDPARHDDGPAGVRAAQADLRARGAGDLRVRRKHATTRERAGQQRGVLPHLSRCSERSHAARRPSPRPRRVPCRIAVLEAQGRGRLPVHPLQRRERLWRPVSHWAQSSRLEGSPAANASPAPRPWASSSPLAPEKKTNGRASEPRPSHRDWLSLAHPFLSSDAVLTCRASGCWTWSQTIISIVPSLRCFRLIGEHQSLDRQS